MENVDKIIISEEVKTFLRKIGFKGGSVKSDKKSITSRENGRMPCNPGKKRGRPYSKAPGVKNGHPDTQL